MFYVSRLALVVPAIAGVALILPGCGKAEDETANTQPGGDGTGTGTGEELSDGDGNDSGGITLGGKKSGGMRPNRNGNGVQEEREKEVVFD